LNQFNGTEDAYFPEKKAAQQMLGNLYL